MSKHKKYKAFVNWQGDLPQEIIVPICLRSPAVHGRRFIKTLEAIRAVPKIHVIICDMLDSHNLVGISPNPLQDSLEMADKWLEVNFTDIQKIIPQHDLVRWEQIRSHPNFAPRLNAVTEAYYRGTEVRSLIDGMAEYYINKKTERINKLGYALDIAQESQRSRNYLFEEMAGDMTYAEMFPNAPRVYWGLSVDDVEIFKRNLPDIGCSLDFPRTMPVSLSKTPPNVAASELYKMPKLAA